jgi:glutamate synthase (NADPH/NADH) small chain
MTEQKIKEKIPRQKMPEQDPAVRARNFAEVPCGYTPELAQLEARRCLQCKKPKCRDGCPVEIEIPAFIALIAEGDFAGAARKLKERNSLPAVCGRVCPQEDQCEKLCIVGKKNEPAGWSALPLIGSGSTANFSFLPKHLPREKRLR